MIIESVALNNFRRFKEATFQFGNGFNVLVGKNGTGKTTILESIYILSTGRSFVTNTLQNCLNLSEDYFLIEGKFKDKVDTKTLSFLLRKEKKEIYLNKDKVKKLSQIIGKFPVVITDYSLVELVKEGPAKRRDFINHVLIFTDKDYYSDILKYYAYLEKRNSCLKSGNFTNDLIMFLSQEMYDYGVKIRDKRAHIVEDFNGRISDIFNLVFGRQLDVTLEYIPSDLKKLLDPSVVKDEISKKRTLYGIHLDEFELYANGVNLRTVTSLGEAESIGFILKLIETELIERYLGEVPILLLDDFFSHLDTAKREKILNMISHLQVILTAINLDDVTKNVLDKATLINLEGLEDEAS